MSGVSGSRQAIPLSARPVRPHRPAVDQALLLAALTLLGLGLVMVGSASITVAERQLGQPFHYLVRQGLFVGLGLSAALLAAWLPVAKWERLGAAVLLLGIVLLTVVLVPGVGREVNGSMRWLALGPFNLQPSELVKLGVVLYLPGYLVRREEEVRAALSGLVKPMLLLLLICLLLLLEPDFGAAAVIFATALGVLFLGGVRLWHFGLFVVMTLLMLAALAVSSPYRVERLTTFMNPWLDPFNSGFQLTQALIAFGRGEWFGVGLGDSVQKLFYLPEAHTDFLFAVLAEELGLVGALLVIALFGVVVWRSFAIARRAEANGSRFGAYLAYGIGLWLGLQAFVNLGVNMGVLPTKGLTLPLMSYGGSSIVVSCVAVAIVLRVGYECRPLDGPHRAAGFHPPVAEAAT